MKSEGGHNPQFPDVKIALAHILKIRIYYYHFFFASPLKSELHKGKSMFNYYYQLSS